MDNKDPGEMLSVDSKPLSMVYKGFTGCLDLTRIDRCTLHALTGVGIVVLYASRRVTKFKISLASEVMP